MKLIDLVDSSIIELEPGNELKERSVPKFHARAEIKKGGKRTHDLGMGYMGNGLTIWDRSTEEGGDYKKVAHIQHPEMTITWNDKSLPPEVKKEIEKIAKAEKKAWEKGQHYYQNESLEEAINESEEKFLWGYQTRNRKYHVRAVRTGPKLLDPVKMTIKGPEGTEVKKFPHEGAARKYWKQLHHDNLKESFGDYDDLIVGEYARRATKALDDAIYSLDFIGRYGKTNAVDFLVQAEKRINKKIVAIQKDMDRTFKKFK